jgi:hypothetical protein
VLICGLIFGGKDKFMCANSLGKKLILFSITLALGVLSVNFFVSNKPAERNAREQPIRQNRVSGEIKSKPALGRQNCFPVESDSDRASVGDEVLRQFFELSSKKTKIEIWLHENPDASERETAKHLKRLEIIEKQIRLLKSFEEDSFDKGGGSRKLLYVEECYDEF